MLILGRALRGHLWPTLLGAGLVAGLAVLIAASYESFGGSEIFRDEEIPSAFTAFLKAEGSLLFASGAQGYLAITFRHPIVLVVLAAFAVGTASSAMAREIENRTILLLLARPVPRERLVLEKALGSSIVLMLLVMFLMAGTALGGLAFDLPGLRLTGFVPAAFNAFCLALSLLGIAYMISARSNDGSRASLASSGAAVVLFFIDFMSDLFDSLDWLGYVSVFHYYDPVSAATVAGFPLGHCIVLLSVAAIGFGAAVWTFGRRDIAV